MGINIVIVVAVVIAAALVIRSYIARGGKGDCCGGADVVRAKGPADRDASHYAHTYEAKESADVDGLRRAVRNEGYGAGAIREL